MFVDFLFLKIFLFLTPNFILSFEFILNGKSFRFLIQFWIFATTLK